MQTTTHDKKDIPSLTGLRGVAALCVLFNHYSSFVMPLPAAKAALLLPGFFLELFNTSDYGMSMFFVLSGFVIAYNYAFMPWGDRPIHTLARFFTYRFARLYPLLLFFVILVIWSRGTTFNSDTMATAALQRDILTAITATHAWFPLLSANGDMVIGGNFFFSWSISTELFLYATFAALLLVATRFARGVFRVSFIIVYGMIAVGLLWFLGTHGQLPFFAEIPQDKYDRWLFEASPFYRSLEFCLGMFAFVTFTWLENNRDRHNRFLGLARRSSYWGVLILAVMWGLNLFHAMHLPHPLIRFLAAFAVFLMVMGCNQQNRINHLLSGKVLLYIGTISYSLYLFHFLPPNFVSRGMDPEHFNDWSMYKFLIIFTGNFVLSFIFALAMATGLYQLVEVPSRRFIRAAFERYFPQ